MGIVSDFFKFFTSVMLGSKDSNKAFLEPLNMAERYVRWGEERHDLRDFIAAFNQLDLCRDEDAPKADLLLRKYMAMTNAVGGAVVLMIGSHKNKLKGLQDGHQTLVKEKATVEGQIKTAHMRIEQLKKEGSLIKAKEEEKHVEELNIKLAHLSKVLETGEDMEGMYSSYDQMVAEAERMCQRLEGAVLALEVNEKLSADAVNTLRTQITGRVEEVRQKVAELEPEGRQQDDTAAEDEEETDGETTAKTAES